MSTNTDKKMKTNTNAVEEIHHGEQCPKCRATTIPQGGCVLCPSCGWSGCFT